MSEDKMSTAKNGDVIIEVKNLKKVYDDHVVLSNINTTIKKGEYGNDNFINVNWTKYNVVNNKKLNHCRCTSYYCKVYITYKVSNL